MSWCQPQRRRGNERARARCPAAMALVRGGVARHDGHCDGSYLPKVRAWLPLNPSRAPHTCNHNALRSLNPVALWVIEGFSHFVTSMTAPIASGWSGCRMGFAPTGKRRLCTAHAKSGRWGNRSPSRRSRAAEVSEGFEIDDHLSVRSPLLLNDRTSEACCSFAS